MDFRAREKRREVREPTEISKKRRKILLLDAASSSNWTIPEKRPCVSAVVVDTLALMPATRASPTGQGPEKKERNGRMRN